MGHTNGRLRKTESMRLVTRLRFVVDRRVIYAFAFMGLCLVVFALLEAIGVSLGFWDY